MALEFVGGALLSASLQVAFEKLASPEVLDFFRGSKFDHKLLTNLNIKLQSIQALADNAEQKQFRDQHVRNWLLEVKDVVLDAEDLLDEIQHEFSKGEDEAESESQTCTCKVPNFFKSSPLSSFNKEIKSRTEQVLDNLEFLSSQQSALGLRNSSGVGVGSGFSNELSSKLPSTSSVVESVFYGRDDDKEIILNWLTSNTDNGNKLSILSIVGMGGVGKTTLAQHVYNDPLIEGKFDSKAWVCVSDDFDVFKLTRTILERITGSTDDSRDLEMVHGRLKEKLKGKKLLLVLDDVWNIKQTEWEAVVTLTNFGTQGSRILVTTRSKDVASTMGSKQHHLELLQEDFCWQLFAEHAFQNANPEQNPDFKEISVKIVKKCKGLPLALKTVGSLLHNKSIREWKNICQNEIWEWENSDIVPALALSYHHLPSHLKRCFAYCSLFPKDYVFDKECLILLWMAQKFLQCSQQSNVSLEYVGEQYFNGLLSRCFFQQSSIMGKRCFVMHDLLHDLARYVCGDNCFRLEVDEAKNIPKTTRHFSVATNHIEHFDGFGTYDTTRLRTFLPTSERMDSLDDSWHCEKSISELFSKCKFLRVLSLSCCSQLMKVPEFIGNLIHLHSLDLSYTDIIKVPESSCSLYNLQILKLNSCRNLKELPSNLFKLTNLRRLELIKTELRKMPPHLGKLKNLQVLMNLFDVDKSREFSFQELGELNIHGSLTIKNLQNIEIPSDALAMDLKNKTQLVQLKLKWDDSVMDDSARERDESVIENLQPSKHLEKLKIRKYGGKQFPRWLSDKLLWNMVSLTLEDCQFCQQLPSLGVLPFLKDLKISGLDGIVSIDTDFYGSISCSFTSLETLQFYSMKELERWECEAVNGAFPRLQHLSVKGCPKLKGHLPDQLIHLKYLGIRNCEQLVASFPMAPEIHELILIDCGKLQFNYHPTTLKEVTVRGDNMDALLQEMIGHLISVNNSLEFLDVDSCPNNNTPMSDCHNFHDMLCITDACDSLITFPLDLFPALRQLQLVGCCNLQMISLGHVHNQLEELTIRVCLELESLPEHMDILLPSLDRLEIRDCPKVELSPDGGLPSNLERMYLVDVSKIFSSLKRVSGTNSSVKSLAIEGMDDVECLPEEGLLPLSLTHLTIGNCRNLKKLDYKGLCHLSSLKYLSLESCPSLESLPEEGLPKSISRFGIINCPLLQKRCQEPDGEDWPKIAHIEYLSVFD